jgi:nicotinamidase-related amidase
MDGYTRPDFSSVALITIDTQRDTLDGQLLEISGTSAILPNMARLLKAFRASGRSIIHVVRIYRSGGSNVDPCRRAAVENGCTMFLADSPGAEIAAALLPDSEIHLDSRRLLSGGIQPLSEHEVVIYKPRWGAFYNTPLQTHLQELGISTLVFTGCNFPNCPRTSVYEASERDYRVVLVTDAISGLYRRGAVEMQNIGVALCTTDEVLGRITAAIDEA